ncbi:MAG: HlyC/CorC family transporter [Lentisphaeria bacterium]|nr:HlyC/CorC family transporter [Lentisphaeria bacterium]
MHIFLLIIAVLCLLWLTCAFEAFDSLSGGRIRKVETKDKVLAAKLEEWMEHDNVLRALLKILMFVTASLVGGLGYVVLLSARPEFARQWWWAVIIAAIAIAAMLSEIFARFILFRLYIFMIRTSIPPVYFIARTVLLPFSWLLEKADSTTDDWHKSDRAEDKVSVEDEILSYVDSYNDDTESDLQEGEKEMIRGILEIGDMSVRAIMTPRVDLVALPGTASIDEAKKLFIESGHSRIPVYGRNIDEIRGVIYAKDFLTEEQTAGKTLFQLAHTPIFIPETKEVAELLEEIKRSRNHFAVIIDEFGGTSGVATFEDIIEEIVGEVHDEYDTESDIEKKPQMLPNGTIVLEARTPITDVNDIADVEIPEIEGAETIGGYICASLGRIPEIGTEFIVPDQFRAVVLDADTRKIKSIRLELLDPAEEGA